MKKNHAIIPVIIAMCFLPADISIKIGNINFQAIRILAIFGFIRVYSDAQRQKIKFNTIDKLFFWNTFLGAVIYIIASQNITGAFIYKFGVSLESMFLYLFIRNTIQSKEDMRLTIKAISICVIFLLPFTLIEYFTGNNLFSIVGRSAISIRDGKIRAAGTFSHAILYGSFAAAVVPLLWADYKIEKSITKLFAILACLFIIFACQSSGPIVAIAGAFFFLFFFKWKQHGSTLAWSILCSAIFIHFVREKPLWHFLYVSHTVKASSTGYHRYLMCDAAFKEFWNWCLLGYGDVGAQWHHKYWPGVQAKFTDITNQYLIEGVRGGFLTLLIFMILCFKTIKVLGAYAISQSDPKDQWLWWGFTVTMITHCISFLSVSYFGQINMLLYLTIVVAAYAQDEAMKEVVLA